jgi:hypothetical protein
MDLFLKIVLAAFTNLSSEKRHSVFHILTQISTEKLFPDAFISSNGLQVLSLTNFPLLNHCTLCKDIDNPYKALLKLFNGKDGFSRLGKNNVKAMLRSMGVICQESGAKEAPSVAIIIQFLLKQLISLGYEGNYHQTAKTCLFILNQERLQEQENPGSWNIDRYEDFRTQTFESWEDSMRVMIDTLKGTILPIKEELVTLHSVMRNRFSDLGYISSSRHFYGSDISSTPYVPSSGTLIAARLSSARPRHRTLE